MKRSLATAMSVALAALAASSHSAVAASLPAVEASSANTVPACVTPGRLLAFLEARNSRLEPKFGEIGVHYMRHGEDLGLRWDYAFFQMLVETNSLKYTGDVHVSQNNFAGLGATGGGVRGESFSTVSDGVRAHLEHIAMYAGKYIPDPVAERTRKVQAWGIMDKWRRTIRGPVTYTQLTRKWAPPDPGYARDIETLADLFFQRHCNAPDPRPELLAQARGGASSNTRTAAAQTSGRAAGQAQARNQAKTYAPASTNGVAVLNGTRDATTATARPNVDTNTTRVATLSPGSMLGGVKTTTDVPPAATPPPPADAGSCKVWEASYGGSRAVLIKAVDGGMTNFTVLDVNKGREKTEANAFIAAYAKGGTTIAEFDNPKAAMKQAFKLCPDK